MQNFGATIKKHYGMLWYFLEWPILCEMREILVLTFCARSLAIAFRSNAHKLKTKKKYLVLILHCFGLKIKILFFTRLLLL